VLLRPDEVAEEEGDREDHQEDLRQHEEDDADPESDAYFLFEAQIFHRRNPIAKGSGKTAAGAAVRGALEPAVRRFT
jgi:hypothetical protein